MNMLIKYADDTNLLVPSDFDVCLAEKFSHIKHWADENRMVINILNTKGIVFRRRNPRVSINPVPISEVQQVTSAKLLGITLCDTLRFDAHIGNVLKICSQRI